MSYKVILIALVLLGCSLEVLAFDFKKELKKVVESEKKKYEEQQKKEKDKNAAPPAQIQPGTPQPTAAPAAAPAAAHALPGTREDGRNTEQAICHAPMREPCFPAACGGVPSRG